MDDCRLSVFSPADPQGPGSGLPEATAPDSLAAPTAYPSPCVGVCDLTEDGGLCRACLRTPAEIAAWSTWEAADKAAVFRRLPDRWRDRGMGPAVPGLAVADLDRWVLGHVAAGLGVWQITAPGVRATLDLGQAGAVTRAESAPGREAAVGDRGGLRLGLDHAAEKIKAIGWPDPSAAGQDRGRRLDLCLYRKKAAVTGPAPDPGLAASAGAATARGVTWLGADAGALRAADRGDPLVDLGLGSGPVRLAVRLPADKTAALAPLRRRLEAACGRPASGPAARDPDLGAALAAAPVVWVVETRLGRLELAGGSVRVLRPGRVFADDADADAGAGADRATGLALDPSAWGAVWGDESIGADGSCAVPAPLVSVLTLWSPRAMPMPAP